MTTFDTGYIPTLPEPEDRLIPEEDLYNDKFEYYDEHSFHYRPGSGPRMKYEQWKNPLLRLWYYVREWFSGSR
jgi:hypothetical protein